MKLNNPLPADRICLSWKFFTHYFEILQRKVQSRWKNFLLSMDMLSGESSGGEESSSRQNSNRGYDRLLSVSYQVSFWRLQDKLYLSFLPLLSCQQLYYLSPNRSREGSAQVNCVCVCVCVSVCLSGTT